MDAQASFSSDRSHTKTEYARITDHYDDIAATVDGDRMRVQLPNRQPVQKIWLWEGKKEESEGSKKKATKNTKATNKAYDADIDGPAKWGMTNILPTAEELTPNEAAVEYLEVGLVLGDNPSRITGERKQRAAAEKQNKIRTSEKAPAVPRDQFAMRVLLPITDYLTTQSKYYVGCRPTANRCYPRVISGDVVFFYDEFWQDVPQKLNKKDRKSHIHEVTKMHAAINKKTIDRSTVVITSTEAEKWATSNPLAVTQAENVVNVLGLQLSLFMDTGDREHLGAVARSLEDVAADLIYSPGQSDPGTASFHNFNKELSEKAAASLKRELKVANIRGFPDLDIGFIQLVHKILRENGWGDRLPYGGLHLFLEACHEHGREEYAREVVAGEVENALKAVVLSNRHQYAGLGPNDPQISKDRSRTTMGYVVNFLQATRNRMRKSNEQLAQQHGGMLAHGSLKDLMLKISNAVDVANQQVLWEQLAYLHAIQHAYTNSDLSDVFALLQKTLEQMARAVPMPKSEEGEATDVKGGPAKEGGQTEVEQGQADGEGLGAEMQDVGEGYGQGSIVGATGEALQKLGFGQD